MAEHKQRYLPHSPTYFWNEFFASGFILCHRVIGTEVAIKIIPYRDQLYREYEPMPPELEDRAPDVPEAANLSEHHGEYTTPLFLGRIKLASVVMDRQAALDLSEALKVAVERADRGEIIPEE